MNEFQKFYPLVKVDEATRMIYGLVTAECPDRDGEIMHFASTVPYYQDLNEEFSKATEGRSIAPLREMHQLSAVGVGKSIDFKSPERAIYMGFKVVDDPAWKKVMEGVYTGFSHGGNYVKTWRAPWTDPETSKTQDYTWYTAKPGEISLVDSPCLKNARFTIVKANGQTEERAFKAEVAGAPNTPASTESTVTGPVVAPPYGGTPGTGAESSGETLAPTGSASKCRNCGAEFKAMGAETMCPKCAAEGAGELKKRKCPSCGKSMGDAEKCPACGEAFDKAYEAHLDRLLDKAHHGGNLWCNDCGAALEPEDLDDGTCQECGADLTDPLNVTDEEPFERVAKTHEGALRAWETRRAGAGTKKPAEAPKPGGAMARSHDLVNTLQGHNKEYHLRQVVHDANHSSVEISYGKRGGALHHGYLRPDGSMSDVRVKMPHASASQVYDARLNQKLGRGYAAKVSAGEFEKAGKTKRVDDQDLSSSDFAYVGDPDRTETWKYPVHNASHARNALARWGQETGIPDDEKPKVIARIRAAAKKHGVEVTDEASKVVKAYQFLLEPDMKNAEQWTARELAEVAETLEMFKRAAQEEGTEDLPAVLLKATEFMTSLIEQETHELQDAAQAALHKGATMETYQELEKVAQDLLGKAHSVSDHLKAMGALFRAHHAKAMAFHKSHLDACEGTIGKCMKALQGSVSGSEAGSASLSAEGSGPSPESPGGGSQGGYPGAPHETNKGLTADDVQKIVNSALEAQASQNMEQMLKIAVAMMGGDPLAPIAQTDPAPGIGDRTAIVKTQVMQTHPAGPKEGDGATPAPAARTAITAETVKAAFDRGDVGAQLELARLIKSGPVPAHLMSGADGSPGALAKMSASRGL